MIHEAVGKIRLIVKNVSDVISAWNVFREDDYKLIPRDVAFERNVRDGSSRRRTAHGDTMQHLWKVQVIDVECLPCNFLPTFFTRDRFTKWIICHNQCPICFSLSSPG